MNSYIGIEVGAVVCCVAATAERGQIARAVFDLPATEPQRSDALPNALESALRHLPASLPPCAACGVSLSPPDAVTFRVLKTDFLRTLPHLAAAERAFAGYEVEALLPHFPAGPGKAWLSLGDRGRVYVEGAEFGDTLSITDEKGVERKVCYAPSSEVLEPVRVLRNRFGLFESLEEMERLSGLVRESGGVRFAQREDGPALFGLGHGIRRPQIARAALEAVASSLRFALSEIAGEGAVQELHVSGPAARNTALMEIMADLIGKTIVRSEVLDAAAYGAAMRASAAGEVYLPRPERKRFNPTMPAAQRDELYARWLAVRE